jgi:hypothetical protein
MRALFLLVWSSIWPMYQGLQAQVPCYEKNIFKHRDLKVVSIIHLTPRSSVVNAPFKGALRNLLFGEEKTLLCFDKVVIISG